MNPTSAIAQTGHWPPSKHRQLPTHRNIGLEIIYIAQGQLRWHVRNQVERIGPGSIFYTLPWEPHGSVEKHEPGCVLFFAIIHLGDTYDHPVRRLTWHPALDLSDSLGKNLSKLLLGTEQRCWPASPTMAHVLPQLVAEHQRDNRSIDALHAWAKLAMIELGRCLAGPVSDPHAFNTAHQRVRNFLLTLDQQCHQRWTLGKMAQACNLGRTRFAQVLQKITGDSPVMTLHRARIRRARRLLTQTSLPITRIALDCGYATSQHFAAVFRQYTHQNAQSYRRTN